MLLPTQKEERYQHLIVSNKENQRQSYVYL